MKTNALGTSIQQEHPTIWLADGVSAARTRAELTLAAERSPPPFRAAFPAAPGGQRAVSHRGERPCSERVSSAGSPAGFGSQSVEIGALVSSENTQLLRKGRKERPAEQRSLLEKKQEGFPTAPANRPSPNLCETSQGRSFYNPLTLSGSERLHQPSPQPSPAPRSGYSGSSVPCQEAFSVPAPWKSLSSWLDAVCSDCFLSLRLTTSLFSMASWPRGQRPPWQHNTQDPMVC